MGGQIPEAALYYQKKKFKKIIKYAGGEIVK